MFIDKLSVIKTTKRFMFRLNMAKIRLIFGKDNDFNCILSENVHKV